MTTADSERSLPDGEPDGKTGLSPMAFMRLYRTYYDALFRYCVHRLFERHAAEDMISEIFLKAIQNLHRLDGRDERRFRSWLYQVATNEINAHLRKVRRRRGLLQRYQEQPHHAAAGLLPPDDEQLIMLRAAMFELKPRYQAVIALRYFENLKAAEIAEVLGCSPSTARSQLARAMAQLRRKLGPACGATD